MEARFLAMIQMSLNLENCKPFKREVLLSKDPSSTDIKLLIAVDMEENSPH